MAVANAASPPKSGAPKLSPEKGNELRAVLLLGVGALLAASFVSYQPSDPSFLHQVAQDGARARNWVGGVGAQLAAVGFSLLGLCAFLGPLLLLVAGIRRWRRKPDEPPQVSRLIGAFLLLFALPGLLQIAFGRLPLRGEPLEAGGAFGKLLAALLVDHMNVPGALLVLLALVTAAATLLLQSTLGETLARWWARLRAALEERSLARQRSREQKNKEKARKRVEAKHVERALEEKRHNEERAQAALAASMAVPVEGPVRVMPRSGERGFGIRRVVAGQAAFNAPTSQLADFDLHGSSAGEGDRERAEPYRAAGASEALPPPAPALRPAKLAPPRQPAPARQPQAPLPFAQEPPAANALPPINLLQLTDDGRRIDENELVRLAEVIRQRCAEFGVEGTVEGISPGPVITVFEFQPAPGVKVSQIVNLQDDLALALKAESVRIDRLPGRSTLGIEVPNKERQMIRLGSLLAKEPFQRAASVLTMALGVTIHGEPYYCDLATMPHLLVAGATGAGKSVGLQSMITSILYKGHPDEVQFIFVDPKRIELGVYADIPSLLTPVVVEPKQAANVLNHMVAEMEGRYKKLAKVHVRSIAHYNQAIRDPEQRKRLALNDGEGELGEEDFQPLPYIVIIIDELADLMMVASADVETAIARLAQMARAVGIHLIVATQRPSVDVLTGTIKANFPCRISFATASRHDSRTILDQVGSEKLLGKGDMLFMPPGTSRVMRLHGAYVSEQETAGLIRWLKKQGKPQYDLDLLEPIEGARGGGEAGDADDDLFDEASRLVVQERMASASFLQRRMRIGFSRASRLIDMMEREGLLGPPQGSKPREVLVPRDYFSEVDATHD